MKNYIILKSLLKYKRIKKIEAAKIIGMKYNTFINKINDTKPQGFNLTEKIIIAEKVLCMSVDEVFPTKKVRKY